MGDHFIGIPPDHKRHGSVAVAGVPEPWSIPKSVFQPIWDAGITGKGFTVAIVDTGVANHPQLPTPIAGRNFTGGSSTNYADRNGHGSHCAGSSVGRDGIGVAPGANLIAAKVLDDGGSGATTWIRSGTVWASENGADVISRSLGGRCGGSAEQREDLAAIDRCYQNGTGLIVDAAGNASGGSIGCPGAYATTFCVGATRKDGRYAGFESMGKQMDVATPGENITSVDYRGGFTSMSGTSMATPFFAGLMVLVMHARRRVGMPDLIGAADWRKFFIDNELLEDRGDTGHDTKYGHGVPDVAKIIEWLRGSTWA